ncbi:quinoprotein, partial [Thioclava sp. BHET1]
TVEGNRVYVAARDSSGWAIDTRDGKIVWHVDGATPDGGVTGGAAPALSARFAIMPLPGGQILGLVRSGGTQVWSTPVVGERLGQGYAALSDITGDPVVVGNTVYVGNSGGQLSALDADDGTQIWTKREGVAGPVWPAGNSIFVVSDQAKLQRLDARTGDKIWAVDLPYYVPVKKRKNRLAIYVNYGPIIAGNRLWVSCSDGVLRGFDPASGKLVASVALGAGAASAPVVAGGVLYLVTEDGQLRAFR